MLQLHLITCLLHQLTKSCGFNLGSIRSDVRQQVTPAPSAAAVGLHQRRAVCPRAERLIINKEYIFHLKVISHLHFFPALEIFLRDYLGIYPNGNADNADNTVFLCPDREFRNPCNVFYSCKYQVWINMTMMIVIR